MDDGCWSGGALLMTWQDTRQDVGERRRDVQTKCPFLDMTLSRLAGTLIVSDDTRAVPRADLQDAAGASRDTRAAGCDEYWTCPQHAEDSQWPARAVVRR